MSPPRLALLADFPEEGWHSMDLCAEMLMTTLRASRGQELQVGSISPRFVRRFGRAPLLGTRALGVNADRLLNRMWDYPRWLRRRRRGYDYFHLCDHSYSQLVHELPPGRTGVFCHDLDTFTCILQPGRERRPFWFRAMTRRIFSGMQKAALVFHTTQAVRAEILESGMIDPKRLVQAPLGVAREFTASPARAEPECPNITSGLCGRPYVLHVGSCIARKRIDVLLDAFARARSRRNDLCLVKAGGDWSPNQREQIRSLELEPAIFHFRGLSRSRLAELYRQASAVLAPSEKEGFGLTVIEALACGAPVIASDIPALHESGGAAAIYVPVGAVDAWADAIVAVVDKPNAAPAREARLRQAAQFSWDRHARIIADAYLNMRGRG